MGGSKILILLKFDTPNYAEKQYVLLNVCSFNPLFLKEKNTCINSKLIIFSDVLPSLITKHNKLVFTLQVHEYMQLIEIYNTMQCLLQVSNSS